MENIESYKVLYNKAQDGVIIIDNCGKIQLFNHQIENLFGYSKSDLIGKEIGFLIPNFLTDYNIESAIGNSINPLKGEKELQREYWVSSKEGNQLGIEVILNNVQPGDHSMFSITIKDITDHLILKKEWADNGKFSDEIQVIANLGTYILNIKTHRWIGSDNLDNLLGIDINFDRTTENWLTIVHPDWRDSMETYLYSGEFLKNYKFDKEYKIIRKRDGAERWVRDIGNLKLDEHNEPRLMMGTLQDITERKLMEIELKTAKEKAEESNSRLRNYLENAPDGVFVADQNGRYLDVNPAAIEITGYSKAELLDMSIKDITPEDSFSNAFNHFRTLQEKGISKGEIKFRHRNGTIRWWSVDAVKLSDNQFIGFVKDITERKENEGLLIRSKQHFQSLVENISGVYWVNNLETHQTLYISPSYEKIWKRKRDDLYKSPVDFINAIYPDDKARLVDAYQHIGDTTHQNISYRIVRPGGEIRWVSAKINVILNTEGEKIEYGYAEDITEKRNAEELLKESERFLKETQLIANLGTYTMDLTTGNWTSSEIFNEIFGIDEHFARTAENWPSIIHPAWRATMDDYFKNEILGKHCRFDKEYKIVRIADKAERWVHSQGTLKFDAQGRPVSLVGTARDITERKELEIELTKAKERAEQSENHLLLKNKEYEAINEKLKQTNRELTIAGLDITQRKKTEAELVKKTEELAQANKDLEQFVYVASHDLQEPLRKIQTYASRILDTEHDHISDKGRDYFKRINSAANRMRTFINDVLAFSQIKATERKFEKINLALIIEEVKAELKEDIEEKTAIITYSELPEVDIIPYQFRQLLNNLISNSLKFTKPGTVPQVVIAGSIKKGSKLSCAKLSPQIEYCHITVADNGIGFENQYSDRIFEVFQRLHSKEAFAGTGIGLAIVKKITENHNGVICASGELGKGARFDIYIPVG